MKQLASSLMISAIAIATSPLIPSAQATIPTQLSQQTLASGHQHIAGRLGRYRFRVRASGYRRGGFSRSSGCPQNVDITALTPVHDENGIAFDDQVVAYLTASDRPTFFLHLPTLPATTGKLTIQNTDPSVPLTQRQVYETDFAITGQSGILGIRVPETAAPLQVGSKYTWQVSIICPANVTDSITTNDTEGSMAYLGGIIERVPDATGTPAERLNFYLREGIWQEALLLTLEAHQRNPSNLSTQTEWSNLMTDVGLGRFAAQPFLGIIHGQ